MRWDQLPPREPRRHLPPRNHVEAAATLVDRECCESRWYKALYIKHLVYADMDPEFEAFIKALIKAFRAHAYPMLIRDIGHASCRVVCAMRGDDMHDLQRGVIGAVAEEVARRLEVDVLYEVSTGNLRKTGVRKSNASAGVADKALSDCADRRSPDRYVTRRF